MNVEALLKLAQQYAKGYAGGTITLQEIVGAIESMKGPDGALASAIFVIEVAVWFPSILPDLHKALVVAAVHKPDDKASKEAALALEAELYDWSQPAMKEWAMMYGTPTFRKMVRAAQYFVQSYKGHQNVLRALGEMEEAVRLGEDEHKRVTDWCGRYAAAVQGVTL